MSCFVCQYRFFISMFLCTHIDSFALLSYSVSKHCEILNYCETLQFKKDFCGLAILYWQYNVLCISILFEEFWVINKLLGIENGLRPANHISFSTPHKYSAEMGKVMMMIGVKGRKEYDNFLWRKETSAT